MINNVDLVDGMIALSRTKKDTSLPINLGNPDEFTVATLADIVLRVTGSRSPVNNVELPLDDPVRRRPDIARASQTLDWTPRVRLEDGVARTAGFYETLLAGDRYNATG